jgi:hypothetical protein
MITLHAREQIWERLKGIVTDDDVREMERVALTLPPGKHYVAIRGEQWQCCHCYVIIPLTKVG